MRKITAETKVHELPYVGEEAAPAKDIGPLIKEFKAQLDLGTAAWVKAGSILVEVFDIDPAAMPRVTREANVAPSTVRNFLRIGRGWLMPQLLAAPKRVRALPLTDQKKVVAGTLPCVVEKPGGGTDIVKVDVISADQETLNVMIGPTGLRTPDEQRVALASAARRRAAATESKAETPHARWKFDGELVYVTHLGVVTPGMVREMAKNYGLKLKRGR